jgi:hypothetical protein
MRYFFLKHVFAVFALCARRRRAPATTIKELDGVCWLHKNTTGERASNNDLPSSYLRDHGIRIHIHNHIMCSDAASAAQGCAFFSATGILFMVSHCSIRMFEVICCNAQSWGLITRKWLCCGEALCFLLFIANGQVYTQHSIGGFEVLIGSIRTLFWTLEFHALLT